MPENTGFPLHGMTGSKSGGWFETGSDIPMANAAFSG
jgi:hypothetical protein